MCYCSGRLLFALWCHLVPFGDRSLRMGVSVPFCNELAGAGITMVGDDFLWSRTFLHSVCVVCVNRHGADFAAPPLTSRLVTWRAAVLANLFKLALADTRVLAYVH
jgi:hypothetical protein